MTEKSSLITTMLIYGLLINTAEGQIRKAEFKIHDRGNLWETVKDDGTIGAPDPLDRFQTYPSMDWPGGPHELIKDEQRSYQLASGIWLGGRHSSGNLFFTENGPFGIVDEGTFQSMEEFENFPGSSGYNPDEAEEVITAEWTSTEKIQCRRISRAWSLRGLNNFIVFDYTFINKNSSTVTDLYIGFPSLIRPSYQDFVVHNGWGDDKNRSDEVVEYDSTNKLLYVRDDVPSPDLTWDLGNYWDQADELRTCGYAGIALLDADASADNRAQPAHVLWTQVLDYSNVLTSSSASEENLYEVLRGQNTSMQAADGERIVPFTLISCGPYTLQPDQSVKIVLVEAVNGIPIETALNGLASQKYLSAGLDSLQHTVQRAASLYQSGYQLSAVPPPAPSLELFPNPREQKITLSWEPLEQTWVNPISAKSDIKEYVIYRSERSFIGPFVKVRRGTQIQVDNEATRASYFNTELNRWVYGDKVDLGVSYFYAVAAKDSAGRESWLTNRNEVAVRATREPADNTLSVKVFPNPFRKVSGFPTTGEENTIVWSNLPAVCTIRIYTSSGELVRKMEHNNLNSGEELWNQLTDSRQRTAPGIYYWSVESAVGSAKGTLLLIK